MTVDLDAMLERAECATWLHMSERELAEKSAGLKPVIPVCNLGQRSKLYHPRTILAVLAARAGVSPEIIAASYGIEVRGAK